MAYYDRVNTDLRTRLLVDLIIKNNPKFGDGSELQPCLIKNPNFFNLHHLVEDTMAVCSDGQYEFNDGIHEDFTDESECKTGTLYVYEKGSSFAEITNVRSKFGILKKGAIRCVVLNPVLEKLQFIFVPKASVISMMGNNKKTSLCLTWNKKQQRFSAPIDKHGCIEYNSFKELAMEPNQ